MSRKEFAHLVCRVEHDIPLRKQNPHALEVVPLHSEVQRRRSILSTTGARAREPSSEFKARNTTTHLVLFIPREKSRSAFVYRLGQLLRVSIRGVEEHLLVRLRKWGQRLRTEMRSPRGATARHSPGALAYTRSRHAIWKSFSLLCAHFSGSFTPDNQIFNHE